MADPKLLSLLRQGVSKWNEWRNNNSSSPVDLRGVDLRKVNLTRANLRKADLSSADLSESVFRQAILSKANLAWANLSGADFSSANLSAANLKGAKVRRALLNRSRLQGANCHRADFSESKIVEVDLSYSILDQANLRMADLRGSYLRRASLEGANLCGANLKRTILIRANCNGAILSGCQIYGASVWGITTEQAEQSDLIISPTDEPIIRVDNLEVAQFVYLMLNHKAIRQFIDAITSKIVLIIGRFTLERKSILDSIRLHLRHRGYVPVIFDFVRPEHRDVNETISILAHMAHFVVADITDARSVPQELMSIVPRLPSVPVQPILLASEKEYGMFDHFRAFPWVLETFLYENEQHLLESIPSKIIAAPERWLAERA